LTRKKSFECGSRNAELGMRKAEGGKGNAEVGMRPPARRGHRGLRPGGNSECGRRPPARRAYAPERSGNEIAESGSRGDMA
jgi:hypothetical protein